MAFLSDRLRLRGVIILFTLPLAIVGYACIANVHSSNAKYGMTFLMATGLYSSVPPVLGWISNNSAGHYKRATSTALQLAIANCGGFVTGMSAPETVSAQLLIELNSSFCLSQETRPTIPQRPHNYTWPSLRWMVLVSQRLPCP